MADWLTSALNGASSALGSFITAKFNQAEAEKQRDWNEQMMDKQNAWSLDMWNRTNEYNSPVEQIERLKAAGLNPLNYGLDGSSANNIQSAQSLGYDRASMTGIENPVASAVNTKLQLAQISNIQADTAKKNNENLTETQRRENMMAEYENIKQELNNKLANELLTDAQRAVLQKQYDWADRINQALISKEESESKLNDSTRNRIDQLLEGEKILQSKNIDDFQKRWDKMDKEMEKISAETDILVEDLENYALNHMQSGMFGSGVSLQNLIRGNRDRHNRNERLRNAPVTEGPPSMSGNSGVR